MLPSDSKAARRDFALEVVRRLRSAGYQALFAGGCVRDLLLDLDPSDFDVATDARPDQVKPLFRRVCEVGESFGVVRVVGPPEIGEVEVATFRSDGTYLDGRRPSSVVFSSPEEDASRRDFTINGMFLDPIDSRVIDFVGGRADLEARVLRAIGDPYARFEEDKLRLLRAPRFAARFGLAIEPRTRDAIRKRSGDVTVVAVERIAQELRKMLAHHARRHAVEITYDLRLLHAVLPPVAELETEPDLWNATLGTLGNLPRTTGFTTAFAALLANIGKPGLPPPRYGHAERAERLARVLCRGLKLSNDEIEETCRLVRHQDALAGASLLPGSRIKPLLASPMIDDLLALHEAAGFHEDAAYCRRYMADPPHGPIDPPPLLGGEDLKRLGLKPGPTFSLYLKEIRRAQLDLELNSPDDAIAWVMRRTSEEAAGRT